MEGPEHELQGYKRNTRLLGWPGRCPVGWTDTAPRSVHSVHKALPKESELKSLELFDLGCGRRELSLQNIWFSADMVLASILNREESWEVF